MHKERMVGDIAKLEKFRFYWIVRNHHLWRQKKDQSRLNEGRYGFVVQEVGGSLDGLVLTGKAKEEKPMLDAENIRFVNETNYFFETDQNKAPSAIKQKVLEFFFESKGYAKHIEA